MASLSSSRVVRPGELAERLGVSRVTLWRWERQGRLPQKRQIGPNVVGWLDTELDEWFARTDGDGAVAAQDGDGDDPPQLLALAQEGIRLVDDERRSEAPRRRRQAGERGHKRDHLPGHLVKAAEEEDLAQAIDVVRQLKAINAACLEILQKSRADGKHLISLRAVDRIHKQIELQARLLGELQEAGPQVNVLVAAEWHQIRVQVFQALEPFPEARAAVSAALVSHGGP